MIFKICDALMGIGLVLFGLTAVSDGVNLSMPVVVIGLIVAIGYAMFKSLYFIDDEED